MKDSNGVFLALKRADEERDAGSHWFGVRVVIAVVVIVALGLVGWVS